MTYYGESIPLERSGRILHSPASTRSLHSRVNRTNHGSEGPRGWPEEKRGSLWIFGWFSILWLFIWGFCLLFLLAIPRVRRAHHVIQLLVENLLSIIMGPSIISLIPSLYHPIQSHRESGRNWRDTVSLNGGVEWVKETWERIWMVDSSHSVTPCQSLPHLNHPSWASGSDWKERTAGDTVRVVRMERELGARRPCERPIYPYTLASYGPHSSVGRDDHGRPDRWMGTEWKCLWTCLSSYFCSFFILFPFILSIPLWTSGRQ